MKTKVAVTILSLILVVAVVLFCQIFNVSTIEIVYDGASQEIKQAVLANCGIEKGDSIFSLSKADVRKSVEKKYKQIAIEKVEKFFPSTVKIYARTRQAIVAINATLSDGKIGVVPTDRDFQINNAYNAEDIDYDVLIRVSGVTAPLTFDVSEFVYLRRVIYSFIRAGFTEDGLVAFLSEFRFEDDGIYAVLRGDQTSSFWIVKDAPTYDDIALSVRAAYDSFLATAENDRGGKVYR